MRLLFVVPYIPNLIRVRPYNLLRHLAERGNRISLLTLWSNPAELESLAQVQPYVEDVTAVRLPRWRSLWNVAKTLPSQDPLQAAYCWEPALVRQLVGSLKFLAGRSSFDAVHVEHLRGARYGLQLKSLLDATADPIPVVWDSVDSISLLFRQAMIRSKSLFSRSWTRFELSRTERYEGWLMSQFDWITVTSKNDREALLSLLPSERDAPEISILPNGVDLDYFHPDSHQRREPATLILSGKMSYHANVTMAVEFVQQVMPSIWAYRPDVRLMIVGKDPTRPVLALAKHPQVMVTGTVPHLPPYLQRAAIAVAPISYGAGIQNKVLEAMGCATPVITSPQAASSLEAVPGQDLLVARTPEEYTEGILDLLDDPVQRRKIGQAGRQYVERCHNWDTTAANLESIYLRAAEGSAIKV